MKREKGSIGKGKVPQLDGSEGGGGGGGWRRGGIDVAEEYEEGTASLAGT